VAEGVTVLRGGTILTGLPDQPVTDALAFVEDRVVGLGAACAGDADTTVDLGGGTVVPGFRDGHIHPLWGGTESLDAPVVEATDFDDLLRRVEEYAGENPDLPWILGHGYPCEILPRGIGRAEWLDRAVPDRPAALWASDHHTLWVNTCALAVARIGPATPDPPTGTIVRDPDGRAAGTLLEDAMALVERHVPKRGPADKARGLRVALRQMAAAGIVWAQEAALAPEDVAVYLDVAAAGDLTADVNIALRVDPSRWLDQLPAFLEARALVEEAERRRRDARAPGGRVSLRTVKVFADGVIESGTGALLEPYEDRAGDCGILMWDRDDMIEAMSAFDHQGFQLHVHAIGDAAIRCTLDVLEETVARHGARDRRPVIAHTQLIHPEDLRRFATVGVIANFEPLWAQRSPVMTELTEPRLGAERSAWQYPMGSVLRSGAALSFGSDWPVSSMVPMEGVAVAVHRQTDDGEPPGGWLPEERLTLDEALAAYTAGTAYQAFDDDAGTLEPGMRADLCLLGDDLLALPPLALSSAPVRRTWLGGVEVFGE
jgi:predicted amidohydrolase YtcJ